MLVLDASAAVHVLLDSSTGTRVAARIAGGEPPHVPHVFDVEVLSALRRHVVERRITARRADEAVALLNSFPGTRYGHVLLLPRAWRLRHELAPYDAVYVALAEILDAPLITTDARLANAHGHHARIELIA